ncbi:hypothetical protein JSY36_03390 [Bacillus sp. H-16]|uniref:hypothetical protein n=1 Tax=Alteribacter salitolerans TaxID=2912333 RepID=UPI001964C0B2|nr:hypothetical protein [Alteribacter salitolerans]MBM7094791.1 hypothetical protein [Alteribacter salitolerans]
MSRNKKEIKRMVLAYEALYIMESNLKDHAMKTLCEYYGKDWTIKTKEIRGIERLTYYEIIDLYVKHPPLINCFTRFYIMKFYELSEVRNKIAHVKPITKEEYSLLKECSEEVINQLN